jgi:hypothetical protein
MRLHNVFVLAGMLLAAGEPVLAFDHDHAAWDALLKRHVVVAPSRSASRVDYAGFAADRRALQAYLDGISAVTEAEYRTWTREQKLAFLINAYNAYTVDLVLTRYPDLRSIKDLGWLLKSPWKKEFFTLLGASRSLDGIEQGLIRSPGVFDEPRIHFAVNCASIGCPMLRDEAFAARGLEAQLEDCARRFLSDRSRNRYDAAANELQVSRIFDWYRSDFGKDDRGSGSITRYFARYAELLADTAAAREAVRQGREPIRYLEYDWALNDIQR